MILTIVFFLPIHGPRSDRAKCLRMEISCASHFSCSCNQILIKKQLKGERGYSDLSVRGIVHHSGEGMAADSSEVVGERCLFTSCHVRKQTGTEALFGYKLQGSYLATHVFQSGLNSQNFYYLPEQVGTKCSNTESVEDA